MNTIVNNTRIFSIALATLFFVAFVFALAPKAQAADLDGGDGIMVYPDQFMNVYPDQYMSVYPDQFYDTGYYTPSYYTGGYSYGGGFTGGWSFGGGYGGGSSSSFSSVYAPTNTCTATNSCNTTYTYDDHSVVTYTSSAPVAYSYPVYQPSYPVYYAQPTYTYAYNDVCANLSGVQSVVPTGYTLQNGNCNYVPTYTQQPYVTLAAVPYTGLELGFWGTIAYWGFLVLWCLIAAYLIAVKKIQNKVAAWFTGSATQNSAPQKSSDLPSSGALRATPAGQTFVKHNSAALFAGIDSFILSQINRAK